MKYDVFISYSREDSVVAEELCAVLDKAGVSYWIDRKIAGHADYLKEISEHIRLSKALVYIASANSTSSSFVEKEVLFATQLNKKVVAYCIGGFNMHDSHNLALLLANVPCVESPKALLDTINSINSKAASPIHPNNATNTVNNVTKSKKRKWVALSIVLGVILLGAILTVLGFLCFKMTKLENGNEAQATDYVELAECGLNMQMIYVEGGTFDMGATWEQPSLAQKDEKPVHAVTLESYYIAETEVTQGQWCKIMGYNPSYFKFGDNYPVENVSWYEAKEFCNKLSQVTGKKYTLPTEAQWEYAARGGNKHFGYVYSGSNNLSDVAWYKQNSYESTNPVMMRSPNELGLYDMSGNVYEWCLDFYGPYQYGMQYEPSGAISSTYRVLRGGSWLYGSQYCRVSFRSNKTPESRESNRGFRVVCLP